MSGRRTTQAGTDAKAAQNQAELVSDVAQAVENNEAIEGGRYKTSDDRWVNANGEEITVSGKPRMSD